MNSRSITMCDDMPKYLYVSGMPLLFWGWNGRLVRKSDTVYAMERHNLWGISLLGLCLPIRSFYVVKVDGRWIVILDSPDSHGTVFARQCIPEPVHSLPTGTWRGTFHIGRSYRPSLPIIPLAKFLTAMAFILYLNVTIWNNMPAIEYAADRCVTAVTTLSTYSNFTSLIHRFTRHEYLGIAVGIASYALYAI